jgi:predicted PurR-regulated permease PerM
MRVKKSKLLVPLMLLFFVLQVSAFQEDFSATSQHAKIYACACSTVTDLLSVRNLNEFSMPSTYHISKEGTAASWSTMAPATFIIGSGESLDVYTYISPPCDASGVYDLKTNIRTDFGLQKTVSQDIIVQECQNIQLTPKVHAVSKCPCTLATFELEIRNSGPFTEIYSFHTDKLHEFTTFSENPMVLESGQSSSLFVYVFPTCEVYGTHAIKFKAIAEKSKTFAETTLTLDLKQSCYEYDITLGDYYTPEPNVTHTIVPHPNLYQICEGETKIIPISIKNTAAIPNTYSLGLKGPEWSHIGYKSVSLDSNASFIIDLGISPSAYLDYTYNLSLDITTQLGNLAKSVPITVNVKKCYSPLLSPDINIIPVNYSELLTALEIKNIGNSKATYELNLIAPEWIYLEDSSVTVNPQNKTTVNLHTAPTNQTKQDDYEIILRATIKENGVVYTKPLVIKLRKPSIFREFIRDYGLYVLAGLVALVILITLIRIIKRKKAEAIEEKFEEAVETRKEEVEKEALYTEKKPRWWIKYLLILIIMLAIGGIGYYYKMAAPSEAWANVTITNTTNITLANITEEVTISPNITEEVNVTPVDKPNRIVRAFTTLKSLVKSYVWCIVGVILALIVLIILILVIIRIAKRRKKARKPKKPRRWLLYLTMLIIIIIVALLGYYYYNKYTPSVVPLEENVTPTITEENITIVEPVYTTDEVLSSIRGGIYKYNKDGNVVNTITGEILTPVGFAELLEDNRKDILSETSLSETELDNLINSIKRTLAPEEVPIEEEITVNCTKSWDEDTFLILNLSKFFIDPDGDPLIFTSTDPEHIRVSIDGEIATLTPEPNFNGVDYVVFIADDNKGGIIRSGNLTLCINNVPEPSFLRSIYNNAKEYLLMYLTYIIAGIVILLVLIFLIKYHKPILDFLEEEEEIPPRPKRRKRKK